MMFFFCGCDWNLMLMVLNMEWCECESLFFWSVGFVEMNNGLLFIFDLRSFDYILGR